MRRRRALLWAVALGVTTVFGYLAVRDAHPDEVWRALRESNGWWLLPTFAALALAVLVRALRWQLLFEPATRPPFGDVASAMLVGLALNNLLPFRAGEAARILALGRRAGTSKVETLATVALERALDVFCLLLLLVAAVPVLPELTWLRAAALLAFVVGLGLAAGAVALAVWGDRPLHVVARLAGRLPFVAEDQIERGGHSLMRGLVGLRHGRVAAAAVFWTTVSWLLFSLSFWLATLAFDLDVPLHAGLVVLAAIGLVLILPAAPSGLGVFEAAVVLALSAYGVSRSEALSYAFVVHALNFFPYLVAGAVAVRFTRRPS